MEVKLGPESGIDTTEVSSNTSSWPTLRSCGEGLEGTICLLVTNLRQQEEPVARRYVVRKSRTLSKKLLDTFFSARLISQRVSPMCCKCVAKALPIETSRVRTPYPRKLGPPLVLTVLYHAVPASSHPCFVVLGRCRRLLHSKPPSLLLGGSAQSKPLCRGEGLRRISASILGRFVCALLCGGPLAPVFGMTSLHFGFSISLLSNNISSSFRCRWMFQILPSGPEMCSASEFEVG